MRLVCIRRWTWVHKWKRAAALQIPSIVSVASKQEHVPSRLHLQLISLSSSIVTSTRKQICKRVPEIIRSKTQSTYRKTQIAKTQTQERQLPIAQLAPIIDANGTFCHSICGIDFIQEKRHCCACTHHERLLLLLGVVKMKPKSTLRRNSLATITQLLLSICSLSGHGLPLETLFGLCFDCIGSLLRTLLATS
ncbi:hypothetical protein EDD21DRAFT_93313 [Dissophora ornata]|nr:hypothetical protein EDD21DRAFT_93313 [Dissophora ornata]